MKRVSRKEVDTGENQPWLGLAQYHSNETQAMLQRYNQIENLISLGHHSPSEGNYCENLLRTFLRETLPRRYSVDTGFILGSPVSIPWFPNYRSPTRTTAVSPQLDVIVHDSESFAPVLRSGEFVVVLPDAVCGVIEVKKNLTSSSLKDAVEILAETCWLVRNWRGNCNVFTSLFTFGLDQKLKQDFPNISATFENRYREICHLYPVAFAIPDLLVVAEQLFIARGEHTGKIQKAAWGPTSHSNVNISGQLLLWHLMSNMRLPETTARVGRFQWPSDLPMGCEFEFSNPSNPFDVANVIPSPKTNMNRPRKKKLRTQ